MAEETLPPGPVSYREAFLYWLKYLGMVLGVGLFTLFLARGVLSFDTTRTAGLIAILVVVAVAAGRAVLGPSPVTRQQEAARKQQPPAQTSNSREVVETIVFVVVLVLLLKSFVAEAFVIPTGSMATTLLGYHKDVTCPHCGYKFPVNCSNESEKHQGAIPGCTCPNCRLDIVFPVRKKGDKDYPGPDPDSGDRVLVAKFLYDTHLRDVRPLDVVVFKFPEGPQQDFVPVNYIKRLIGLPGQTIGIHYGNIYVAEGLVPDPEPGEGESQLPLRRRTYKNKMMIQGVNVKDWLEKMDPQKPSPFKILRKPPDKILALQRIVYDNDYQAEGQPHRWAPAPSKNGWSANDAKRFQHPAGNASELNWLHYRHLLPANSERPQLITDFVGYNHGMGEVVAGPNWVGDLILECKVGVEQADGELVLELSEGVDRFQARWQLPSGVCTLVRLQDGKQPEKLAEKETSLKKPGSYHVRFANVDERLTVWVDNNLPFGDGVAYEPPTGPTPDGSLSALRGPTEKNDLEPASIGVQGGSFSVQELKLWRDTYYTNSEERTDHYTILDQPNRWDELRRLPALTMYVEPGHYLCMGDNSPASSDSRSWGPRNNPNPHQPDEVRRADDVQGGLVPKELMLGRALLVYWPFGRFGPIK